MISLKNLLKKPKQVVQKSKRAAQKQFVEKPKQFVQNSTKRFIKSELFLKYKPRVEQSELFKKAKPKIEKPIKAYKRRKHKAAKKREDLRNAPGLRAFKEKWFASLIKGAETIEDPVNKLHELNAATFRINEYFASKGTPKKSSRIVKAVRTRKGPDPEIAAHEQRVYALQSQIDKMIDEIIENNVEAIAKSPNKAWVISPPRVAKQFAIAAERHAAKTSKAVPPANRVADKIEGHENV